MKSTRYSSSERCVVVCDSERIRGGVSSITRSEAKVNLIRWGLIFLFSSCLVAQSAPAGTASAKPVADTKQTPAAAPKKATSIPADAPVITIPGVCASTSAQDCQTVISRADFELLANALAAGGPGGVTPETRGRLASQYGEMLVLANEAEKRGFAKDADTQALLRFAQMQVLAQRMQRSIKEDAQVSDEEVQKYYQEHSGDFQGIGVQRIIIPTGRAAKGKDGKEVNRDTLRKAAEEMHNRLTAGEPAAKLEQEVYAKFGFRDPPTTELVLRPADLPLVSQLKAGEVSDVFPEHMALVIYKSEGEKAMPLSSVKDQIRAVLQRDKAKSATEELKSKHAPSLNYSYFGPEGMKGAQAKPPHEDR